MTVTDLIVYLLKLPDEKAPVLMFDAKSSTFSEVTLGGLTQVVKVDDEWQVSTDEKGAVYAPVIDVE